MGFEALPSRLRAWIIVQSLFAMATAYWLWSLAPVDDWRMLGFLTVCGLVSGACKIDPNNQNARISLTFTVTLFALLVLGPAAATVVGIAGVVGAVVLRHRNGRWRLYPAKLLTHQCLFSMANVVVSVGVMGWCFHAFGGGPLLSAAEVHKVALPSMAAAVAFYVVNGVGISVALAWSQNRPIEETFQDYFGWAWVGFVASASICVGVLWAYKALPGGFAGLLFIPLVYLVYFSFNVRSQKMRSDMDHMREVNRLNEAMIASLAMAIETKDPHTHKHVHRVREYALGLARRVGIQGGELEAVKAAALLHDIGKIGIPETILCKRDKLTPEEYEIIKSHVTLGCSILEQVDFPWPVVPIVRSHHERWDGLGYPDGLAGADIPAGGRIISLVDMYDALTSDRPYRRAIPAEQALQIIRANSGSQFDPQMVGLFIEALPEMDAAIAALSTESDGKTPTVQETLNERALRLEEIANAEAQDDAAVDAELDQLNWDDARMPTFPAQLAARVARLVPYSTMALYVIDRDRQVLTMVQATGQFPHLFEGLEIRVGEGLSGYVAASGESVMNATAGMDLARRIRPGENLELSGALCVPLEVGGQMMGVITLYHTMYNIFQPNHLRRLQRVAAYLARSSDYSEWMETSVPPAMDPVTGLPAITSLQQFLHLQLGVAQSREELFSVLLLTIHPREAMAEVHGLLSARDRDRVLVGVSRLIRECVRDGDQITRGQGCEFAVILPRCGEQEATQIAERIQIRSSRLGELMRGARVVVGIATFPHDGGTGAALLQFAQDRMVARTALPAISLETPPFAIPGYEA